MEKELKALIKAIEKNRVHYSQMNSWNRNMYEGYNDGLDKASSILKNKLKRLTPKP